MFAYINLVESDRGHLWEDLNQLIDANPEILKEVTFAKTSMKDKNQPNTFYLNFCGKPLTSSNALNVIVKKLEVPAVAVEYQDEYLNVRNNGAKIAEAQDFVRLRQAGKNPNDARFAAMPTVGHWADANGVLALLFAVGFVLVLPLIIVPIIAAVSISKAKRELAVRNQFEKTLPVQTATFQPVVLKEEAKMAERVFDAPSEEKSLQSSEENKVELKDTLSNSQMRKK